MYGSFAPPASSVAPPLYQSAMPYNTANPPAGSHHSTSDGNPPSRSVWIGNLPPGTSDENLRHTCSPYGRIEQVRIVPNKNFAFVHFDTVEEATTCIQGLTGMVVRGYDLRLGYGKADDRDRNRGGGNFDRGGYDRDDRDRGLEDKFGASRNLWVGAPFEMHDEPEVHRVFSRYGKIENISMLPAKNCCFVLFDEKDDAVAARDALNGLPLNGKVLKVNFGKDKEKKSEEGTLKPIVDVSQAMGAAASAKLGLDAAVLAGAPPIVAAPLDPELARQVEVLSKYCAKNGSVFEDFIRQQKEDVMRDRCPYLWSSDSADPAVHAYFLWRTYALRNQLSNADIKDVESYQAAQREDEDEGAEGAGTVGIESEERTIDRKMPPTVEAALFALLTSLNGSKDAIKAGTSWIAENSQYSAPIVSRILSFLQKDGEAEHRLFVFYLLSDALHFLFRQRNDPSVLDDFAAALLVHLSAILLAVVQGNTETNTEYAFKVVQLWSKKNIYEASVLTEVENTVRNTLSGE
jgi:RNA recognition motif-containing protein